MQKSIVGCAPWSRFIIDWRNLCNASVFQFTLLELVEYFGLAAIIILLIGFVVIGSPANFFTIWNYFEKKLTLMIYGKYIDIDKHIELHEKELQKIDETKTDSTTKEIESWFCYWGSLNFHIVRVLSLFI